MMASTLSTSEDRLWLAVPEVSAAGAARRAAAALAVEAGLSPDAQADLSIVASELATNLARHALDGALLLRLRRAGDVAGVELVSVDRGPGMADLAESTRDGHSTAGTLGIGLGAIARQAHEFDAYSLPGTGTVLAATVWSHPRVPASWVAGVSRPIEGQAVCGDGYAAREVAGRRQVLLCDGLGHGPLASLAAQAVVAEFAAAPPLGPSALLDHLHRAIRHTRGAVAGVADLDGDRVRFAGIGNVGASIVGGDRRRALVSLPGILGQQRREVREFEQPATDGALLVLHSDGLTEKWDLSAYPGLHSHAPVVVAATLLRDAGRRRDDAAVLVARL
jgi:anti-sigma regulatory factor (Ser/Thr protein kinase)